MRWYQLWIYSGDIWVNPSHALCIDLNLALQIMLHARCMIKSSTFLHHVCDTRHTQAAQPHPVAYLVRHVAGMQQMAHIAHAAMQAWQGPTACFRCSFPTWRTEPGYFRPSAHKCKSMQVLQHPLFQLLGRCCFTNTRVYNSRQLYETRACSTTGSMLLAAVLKSGMGAHCVKFVRIYMEMRS